MKPFEIRRWIHRISGTAALVLLTTGTLVSLPDVRTALIGGQGQFLSDIHLWIGLIFIVAPMVGLLYSSGSILENLKKRILDSKKIHWRRIHLSLALFSGGMLGLTGPIMWVDSILEYPVLVMDAIFLVHLSFAWAVGLVLPAHIFMARKGIVRTIKRWFGLDKRSLSNKTQCDDAISSSAGSTAVA